MEMESARPAPGTNLATLGKTFTKILRLRRAAAAAVSGAGAGVAPDKDETTHKLSKSGNLSYSTELSDDSIENEKLQRDREAMDTLLANLFAGVSAVKAAYAQLQVAQSPYDPETVQAADQAVVAEIKRLSELKQCYVKRQPLPVPEPPLAAQIREQQNLIKTYQITTRKLESDLQRPDTEIAELCSQLAESEKQNRALEARLHPGRTLSAIDDLHLSGLSPTHFLTVVRYTVKSVRAFVKLMVKEMAAARWDVAAAAAAVVHPVELRAGHGDFAFESYVCQMMFSDFQHCDFSLGSLEEVAGWDRRRFFEEFTAAKGMVMPEFLQRPDAGQSLLGKFIRVKYLLLVHPKLEAAIAGDLDQRAVVSSGKGGFPRSGFFAEFAEMAWRVWLLHCLFFSFGDGEEGSSVFQARRGCRFSEVYMESVVEEAAVVGVRPVVGFTVVPGFRVGRTVIQSKVYLSTGSAGKGRGQS